MTAKEIMDTIMDNNYDYFAIRVCDQKYEIGSVCDNSCRWDDGEPTDEELNGACGVAIGHGLVEEEDVKKALDQAKAYFGDHTYLIASNEMEYGEDVNEYVLQDAVVLAEI